MFDWLINKTVINYGGESTPIFNYTKDLVASNFETIFSYYRTNPTHVNSSHLLCRLLDNLNVSFDRDNFSYTEQVRLIGNSVCNALRITTPTNFGTVYSPGLFYGRAADEILYITDEDFDAEEAYANWEELEPIRVMRHPFTDLSMQRVTPRYITNEKGVVVIAINLPMLALQYKAWSRINSKAEHKRSLQQFISMYPLTNMLRSHHDLCFFNRLFAKYKKEDVPKSVRAHSFHITDVSYYTDMVIDQRNVILKRRAMRWDEIMQNIPMYSYATLGELSRAPDIIPTRQIKWAVLIGYLKVLEFLFTITKEYKYNRNTTILRQLQPQIRAFRIDRVLESSLPRDILIDVDKTLDMLMEKPN